MLPRPPVACKQMHVEGTECLVMWVQRNLRPNKLTQNVSLKGCGPSKHAPPYT